MIIKQDGYEPHSFSTITHIKNKSRFQFENEICPTFLSGGYRAVGLLLQAPDIRLRGVQGLQDFAASGFYDVDPV